VSRTGSSKMPKILPPCHQLNWTTHTATSHQFFINLISKTVFHIVACPYPYSRQKIFLLE
jgi:hypothetical protein